MAALHERYSLEDVVEFVDDRLREESERANHRMTISFSSFSTPAHIPVILRHPRYSAYKRVLLPSLEFEDLNELAVLLRDSAISSLPHDGDFVEFALHNPMFRSIHIPPLDARPPDFRKLVLRNIALIDLRLWSDVLRPFVRLAFCDINEITLMGPGRSSVPTSWAENIMALTIWNVSIPRDTLSEIMFSCLKLDILILGHLRLTASEGLARTSAQAASHVHELKELSLINFPRAHMADFLRMMRLSSRVKISVHSLRNLIVAMDPTPNSVLSVDLKHELKALLRDNLLRRSGDASSMLKEVRVVCEAFDGYICGNVLSQISLTSLIRHSRLSKITVELWEKPTIPVQLLSRIVGGLPTHASLCIIFATSGNVPMELKDLDRAILERYEKGRPNERERPPTTDLGIEILPSDSNEIAKHRARENFREHILRQSIRKGYLVIRDSI
ncbi:hypothetical protein EDD18DRAFT_1359563 [Armillaria luteobubalina]|uniref:Uncharacterized protein n=1 Tax=Armillaria luteobubalina TaxID=153913 RepID=A0AA39UGD4_9AGAR|nr:hypothetical protein EDD18DRAFT_1359563 [Armillaria luteobubalina]